MKNKLANRIFSGDTKNVFVAGDLHGDYESFHAALDVFDMNRKDSLLVFLGDYADRGPKGVEIITELNSLLDRRKDIIALKGNHEIYKDGKSSFYPCDLMKEADRKFGSWERFYREVMLGFLAKLHIAAIINNVLFIHAGISARIMNRDDLNNPQNDNYLLWSDPSPISGEHPNPRGAGVIFGEDITQSVLSSLGLEMIVRSHEPEKASSGPYSEHHGKIITINSCSSYENKWEPFILSIDTLTLEYQPLFL